MREVHSARCTGLNLAPALHITVVRVSPNINYSFTSYFGNYIIHSLTSYFGVSVMIIKLHVDCACPKKMIDDALHWIARGKS